jgi:hypothetical protein
VAPSQVRVSDWRNDVAVDPPLSITKKQVPELDFAAAYQRVPSEGSTETSVPELEAVAGGRKVRLASSTRSPVERRADVIRHWAAPGRRIRL